MVNFLMVGLAVLVVIVVWLLIWLDEIWRWLSFTEEKPLKENKVPEGRALYWIGKQIIGQVCGTLGPDNLRLNIRTGRVDYHFAIVILTQTGQKCAEWLWSNEFVPANMEAIAGAPGATFMRIDPDPLEDKMRDMAAEIFMLKYERSEKQDVQESISKRTFEGVHDAIQKFLPKVTYQPKGKSAQKLDMGGGEVAE